MIYILEIVKYIITLQDRNIYFMSIKVILIYTQNVLETQVLTYGMLCSPKCYAVQNVMQSKMLCSPKLR